MEKEFTNKKLFVVQALTDVHCGTGQGAADIDLPTARETATGFPVIPGSTLKGVMRDYFQNRMKLDKKEVFAIFGPDLTDIEAEAHASALLITDARILLLPARSFAGVFAYVTCPLALRRLVQDAAMAGIKTPSAVPEVADGEAVVGGNAVVRVDSHLLLEDLEMRIKPAESISAWTPWVTFLIENLFTKDWGEQVAGPRLALISDTVFGFVCDTALPVSARIRIDKKTGTVAKGALWYEESVPSESVFSGLVAATHSLGGATMRASEVLTRCASDPIMVQLGGKATTGKGLCNIRYIGR